MVSINKTMVRRLKAEIQKSGLNARELAELADVGGSFVYDVLSGKSANPTIHKLAAVADALGISLSYLLQGDKHSLLKTGNIQGLEKVAVVSSRAAGFGGHPVNDNSRRDSVGISSVAIDVSMGGAALVDESRTHGDEHLYYFRRSWIRDRLQASPADLRVVFVRGDSMFPTLQDGDMVLVNISQKAPTPPGIFVLYDGLGLVVKRLEYISSNENPSIRIISDNPQYAPYERSFCEITVIGRVVWFAREL